MSQNRRSRVRRRKSRNTRRKSFGRNRLLMSPERLEDRTLLAADLLASGMNPWHNPYQATDVNFDFETTPLDALIVISELNNGGSRNLLPPTSAAAQAEGETGNDLTFVDVNGDGQLTPLDVLGVVNSLNQPEGEVGSTMTVTHEVTDLDGNPIPNLDGDQLGIPDLIKGQEFQYRVYVQDTRQPQGGDTLLETRLGVFEAYLNVPVNFNLVSTAFQEAQTLTIGGGAAQGTFQLQYQGSLSPTIDVGSNYVDVGGGVLVAQAGLVSMTSDEQAATIKTAIESINGIGAGNVEVSRVAGLTYEITFTGDLANMGVDELAPFDVQLLTDPNLPPVTNVPASAVTVVETLAANPDSDASFLSAVRSASNAAAGGAEHRTYRFNAKAFLEKATAPVGLKNVGATAKLLVGEDDVTIDWAPLPNGTATNGLFTHLLFAVRMKAEAPGLLNNLLVGPPDANDGAEYVPDEIAVWPKGAIQQGDELNLFPSAPGVVGFPDTAALVNIIELANAVDDTAPTPPALILEDSGQTLINVLANDTTVSGIKNLQSIVTQPALGEGTASVVGTQAAYQTSTDFNGQTTFVYRMNDGATPTPHTDDATVTVNVTAVNDAPEFTPQGSAITIDEDAGAQTVNGWATGIRRGPTTAVDEVGQVLTFNETLLNPGGDKLQAADFVALPSVNETTGQLTYQVAPNVNGQAVVQVTLSDNGGTANGGVDTSAAHTLTITVDAVNDTPVNRIDGDADFTAHPQTIRTDQVPLIFRSTNNNEISVDDVDGNVQTQVTLSVGNGTLNVTPTQDVTIQNNGQATVTVTGLRNDVNSAFDGNTVSYTPNQGFTGSDALKVTTSDLGNTGKDPGLTGDGTFEQDEDTVQIEVIPPFRPFAVGDEVTVIEDSGVSAQIQVLDNDFDGSGNRPPTNATFDIFSFTQPAANQGTSQQTGTGTNATFTYTTFQDFFGPTSFTYTVTDPAGPDGNRTGTVSVTVEAKNDEPTFVAIDPTAVNEGAGAQTVNGWAAFDAGPDNEDATQAVKQYNVTVLTNPALFAVAPSVDNNGNLMYTAATDANGQATIQVTVQDDGGTLNGGVDTSQPQDFTITVNSVNDAPSFTASDPAAVNEDAGPQTVNTWATNFDPGPSDEEAAPQNLVGYTVSNVSNPGLFAVAPTVANNGTLTYTPAGDANGDSTFEVTVKDDGGTDRGGVDTSPVQEFTITVNAVNDEPSFTAGNPPNVTEDAGAKSIPSWVTNFDPGPANESSQNVLQYNVNVTENPGLFAAAPAVATNGTLTYRTAQDQHGTAKFTVAVQDDGGTDRNGVDTSTPAQEFTLTVTAVNDAPVNTINGSDDFAANAQSTDDNVDLPFTALNNNLLKVTDVDNVAVATTYQVDLKITNGTLSLGANLPGGLTVTDVLNDDTHLRLNSAATLGDINTALESLVYHPTPGFIGTAELEITSNDGGTSGAAIVDPSDKDTVTISVAPFNDKPDAKDDEFTIAEGAIGAFNVFNANGHGADSAGPNEDGFQDIDVLSYDTTGTVGTVELLNAETGEFRYTPPHINFNGQTTFKYTIQDDGQSRINNVIQDDFKTDEATVTVTVTEVNDKPTAVDDDPVVIDHVAQEDEVVRFSVNDLLKNDTAGPSEEHAGQTLTVKSVSPSSAKGVNNVQLVRNDIQDPTDDEILYTVPANFGHEDTFDYEIEDNGTTNKVLTPLTDIGQATMRDVVPSDITGHVYEDLNNNGQKDPNEPGIGGVEITLEGKSVGSNDVVQTVMRTDRYGKYVFPGVLPNFEGTPHTITQTQPTGFTDGFEGTIYRTQAPNGTLLPPDPDNQEEVPTDTANPGGTNDVINVTLPRFGYADRSNDNNSFAEHLSVGGDLALLGVQDLLHSDGGIFSSGLLFAVRGDGTVEWYINVLGWGDYTPGAKTGPYTYNATVNGNWMNMTHKDQGERQLEVLDPRRLRSLTHDGCTVYRIIGTPDEANFFDLTTAAEGEGEPITAEQTVEMLAAAGNGAQYAAAVDAVLAEAAEMSA